eukprot:SM000305S11814  [mRNA]  locus=s305:123300:123962:- [translate_table: standard]
MDPDDVRELGEYDTVAFRTLSAAAASAAAGTVLGAVTATWQDVPAVQRNDARPALRKTARLMGTYGATFAAIGTAFAAVDAIAEKARGRKDLLNGVLGGFAAGAVIGVRQGSVSTALLAGGAMAALSAFVDASGQSVRTPTGREFLPFQLESPKPPI